MTDDWETIPTMVADFAPEKVSSSTGIDPEVIRTLAHSFAKNKKAVCYGRLGVSTQAFGGVCQWLINVLNIVTGNFDREGGAMFTLPAVDVVGFLGMVGAVGSMNRWQSRVRGLPEFGGELPISALAEEILTEGEDQVKGMVTVAGNPVLSTPNGQQLDKALGTLEFMVSIDIYINETTRHANIILPPQTGLEASHYDLIFHNFAVRNTVKYSDPLFEGDEDTKEDWEIFRALMQRMTTPNEKDKKDPFKRLSPDALLNLGLKYGPYGDKGFRLLGKGNGLTFTKGSCRKTWD